MSISNDPVDRQRRALLELVQLDKSDFDASLPRVLQSAAEALLVERVSFWRLAEDHSRISCERLYCRSSRAVSSGGELHAAAYPRYFEALLEHRTIRAGDARNDPRTSEFTADYFPSRGITSLLDVPVWRAGKLAGVICHEQVGPQREWQDTEVDFALSVGGMIASSLEAQARRRAETRYELLTTALRDLVWDWDLTTDHIAWSETALLALRFSKGEIQPSLEWWRNNIHPDDVQRVMDGLMRHAKEGGGVWRDEYRFLRGDGSWAVIVDRGVLQRSARGEPLRMVGAMVDVTEQRQLEARVAISDRMASVGALAAGVAHEINNPLSYIHGNVSYALGKLEDGSVGREELREALDEALSGVERVQRIVGDLKTLARPDERPAPVEVMGVIESTVRIVHNEVSHRARLRQEHSPVPPVLGNAARLGQVVLNLLMNAAQAIPDGRAEDNEIVVRSYLSEPGRVRIEVEDTGSGIPPEASKRVFDPFFTTKRFGDGLGLGLTICHSIVSGMGGVLTIENNPTRGARARIELRVAPDASTRQSDPGQAPSPPLAAHRGRVLIIDDVANVALSMRRLLSEFHEVETTTRAGEALDALRRGERWSVILCDLMMPDMNGMEFATEVERLDRTLLPTIILMSGGAFTESAQRFLRTWPHKHLEKPIRPDALLRHVNQAVNASLLNSARSP